MRFVSVTVLVLSGGILLGCQTTKEARNLAALGVDFSWTDTTACSPLPPAFTIRNVPAGTAKLTFTMTDLDVPTYNHGGGSVKYDGKSQIPAGSFSYTGPCPPEGAHNYRFDVTAVNAAGDTILGRGAATRAFPPK